MQNQENTEVLIRLAHTIYRLKSTLSPVNILFCMVEYAEQLDGIGDQGRAAQIRTEILRNAPTEIDQSFRNVRLFSEQTPQYQIDANRLKCEEGLLCYSSAVIKLAEVMRSGGRDDKARELYLNALNYFGSLAPIAHEIDGRRRTFETVTKAFATFHLNLSVILQDLGELGGTMFHLEEALRARRGEFPEARERLGEIVRSYEIEELRRKASEYYGHEIPPMEFPITRYSFARNARKWFASLDNAGICNSKGDKGRRIVVAAYNLHHLQFVLALSCMLIHRGHEVDFLYLPSIRFTRNTAPEPDYDNWEEIFLNAQIRRAATEGAPDGLNFYDLRDETLADKSLELEEDCRRLARIDAINMETSIEGRDSEEFKGLESIRYALNLDAARRLSSFFARRRPDLAVVFNGGVMEYGATFEAARRLDIDVMCFEASAQRRGNYVLSFNQPFGALDTTALWRSDEPHHMTSQRRQRVMEWVNSRGGVERFDKKIGERKLDRHQERVLAKEIGLNPDKPIVVLVPNLTWDTGVQGRDTIFESVRDWAISTVEHFECNPDIQLVIRCHPLEETRSDEFLGQFVRERWPQLPQNVVLIDGKNPIDSYQLMDISQLVLVYTGNLGIEAAISGVQTIIAGRPHYAGKGFTREPESRSAYFEMIDAVLADPKAHAVTEREFELACGYGDIYWNYIPQRYPWKYDDFLTSIENDWPMDKVLSDEHYNQFSSIFKYFSGELSVEEGMIGQAP